MAQRISQKHKQGLVFQAERMRGAKAVKRLPLDADSSEENALPSSEVALPQRPPDESELSLNAS